MWCALGGTWTGELLKSLLGRGFVWSVHGNYFIESGGGFGDFFLARVSESQAIKIARVIDRLALEERARFLECSDGAGEVILIDEHLPLGGPRHTGLQGDFGLPVGVGIAIGFFSCRQNCNRLFREGVGLVELLAFI